MYGWQNSDKSLQEKIDELTKENEELKLAIKEAGNKKSKVKNKPKVKEQPQKQSKHFSDIWTIVGSLLLLTGVIAFAIFCYGRYQEYKSALEVKKLQEQKAQSGSGEVRVDDILPEYQRLYASNSDLVGWIVIEGTDINYPVVQSKVYQEFYLDHNFDGEEDEAGAIFTDARNDVFAPDDNIIIYGHNMKNGSMYGTLQRYLGMTYYKEHQYISFDTLYKKSLYRIMAVGLSKISEESSSSFKYYDYLNYKDEKEFHKYINNIKKLQAYDTGVAVNYGDKLITLSTCNSVEKDGRLFIIAKEVNDEKN